MDAKNANEAVYEPLFAVATEHVDYFATQARAVRFALRQLHYYAATGCLIRACRACNAWAPFRVRPTTTSASPG